MQAPLSKSFNNDDWHFEVITVALRASEVSAFHHPSWSVPADILTSQVSLVLINIKHAKTYLAPLHPDQGHLPRL